MTGTILNFGWTTHGHAIAGVPQDEEHRPLKVARCGGPGLCTKCTTDQANGQRAFHGDAKDVDLNEDPMKHLPGVTFHCPNCAERIVVIPIITNVKVEVVAGVTSLKVRFDETTVDHSRCSATNIIINAN